MLLNAVYVQGQTSPNVNPWSAPPLPRRPAKAFQVLLILIRNFSKLIFKGELLNSVWADAAGTES
jgi:hypothetical protein